ncbi:hypothetical protein EVAR_95158_1 [Eumeta japonica]|uniref:Uncharacterized protein n=1 Tax=Eumeta variegata TaxID=151549 RepID=A0A4C1VH99_EUMVA|nr:hypothetical protein EVAR_95158_1 [Eumeta japonica]
MQISASVRHDGPRECNVNAARNAFHHNDKSSAASSRIITVASRVHLRSDIELLPNRLTFLRREALSQPPPWPIMIDKARNGMLSPDNVPRAARAAVLRNSSFGVSRFHSSRSRLNYERSLC